MDRTILDRIVVIYGSVSLSIYRGEEGMMTSEQVAWILAILFSMLWIGQLVYKPQKTKWPKLPTVEMKFTHFKGGKYELICYAKDSEFCNDVIVYRNTETGEIWTRLASEFMQNVDAPGYKGVRFRRDN